MAAAKLAKDRDVLVTFYDFPAEHWKHVRTTNPIESTFATVRHRTRRTKGCLSRKTGLAMAFKLMMAAQGKWRAQNHTVRRSLLQPLLRKLALNMLKRARPEISVRGKRKGSGWSNQFARSILSQMR